VSEAKRSKYGFWVVDLPWLIRMKLTAFRRVDQLHIEDMMHLGLINDRIVDSLPPDLRNRFDQIRATE